MTTKINAAVRLRADSDTAAEAKKLGLHSIGFGRWADKSNKVVKVTDGGKLVDFKADERSHNAPDESNGTDEDRKAADKHSKSLTRKPKIDPKAAKLAELRKQLDAIEEEEEDAKRRGNTDRARELSYQAEDLLDAIEGLS